MTTYNKLESNHVLPGVAYLAGVILAHLPAEVQVIRELFVVRVLAVVDTQ